MQYVVYCDESRHEGPHSHMVIGGLWVDRSIRDRLSKEFATLCGQVGCGGEVKWQKVSRLKFDAYKKILDFFLLDTSSRFRAIVIEQTKVDHAKYNKGDKELGFYKFYYLMLKMWLDAGDEYLILLDFKKNKGSKRYKTLREHLERFVQGKAWISDLTVIDSYQTPLAQLCDVLTGATAAAWCENNLIGAKADLARYLAQQLGFSTLKSSSSSPTANRKFNIFKMDMEQKSD